MLDLRARKSNKIALHADETSFENCNKLRGQVAMTMGFGIYFGLVVLNIIIRHRQVQGARLDLAVWSLALETDLEARTGRGAERPKLDLGPERLQ